MDMSVPLRQLSDHVGGRRRVGADKRHGVRSVRNEPTMELVGAKVSERGVALITDHVRDRHLWRLLRCRATAGRMRPVMRNLTPYPRGTASRAGSRSTGNDPSDRNSD